MDWETAENPWIVVNDVADVSKTSWLTKAKPDVHPQNSREDIFDVEQHSYKQVENPRAMTLPKQCCCKSHLVVMDAYLLRTSCGEGETGSYSTNHVPVTVVPMVWALRNCTCTKCKNAVQIAQLFEEDHQVDCKDEIMR